MPHDVAYGLYHHTCGGYLCV